LNEQPTGEIWYRFDRRFRGFEVDFSGMKFPVFAADLDCLQRRIIAVLFPVRHEQLKNGIVREVDIPGCSEQAFECRRLAAMCRALNRERSCGAPCATGFAVSPSQMNFEMIFRGKYVKEPIVARVCINFR